MAPIVYLCSLLALALVAAASMITIPKTNLFIESAAHTPGSADYHTDTSPFHNMKLLDIVLISSVDGKFSAVNRTSGQPLWSFSTAPTSAFPSALNPLVHTTFPTDLSDQTAEQEIYIIEPQSGDIYVMSSPSGQLQRFPYSMAKLVDLSPFSIPGDERVFIGKKSTSLILIELETGLIKATLDSECPWEPFVDPKSDAINLDDLEGNNKVPPPTEVFIGRTDYQISILRQPGRTPKPPIKLSFSTYGPNNQDHHLQSSYRRTMDNTYIQSLPNGEVISFKVGDVDKSGSRNNAELMWLQTFDSPIVAVFDVLQDTSNRHSSTPHTFVLLQPNPGLLDLIPSLSPDTAPGDLPNYGSAYVGMMDDNGSLFAMTPSRYPLVAFADSDRHHKKNYIGIGGSGSVSDLPDNIDEVTRMRNEKGICEDRPFDRICLVGVRKLEGGDGEGSESRLQRLLDGSTQPPLINGNNSSVVPPGLPEVVHMGSTTSWVNLTSLHSSIWMYLTTIIVLGCSIWWGKRRRETSISRQHTVTEVLERPKEDILVPFTIDPMLPLPSTPSITDTAIQPVLPSSPATPGPLSAATEDNDDSENEEGAQTGSPQAKRKVRRGKRGKKKKAQPTNSEDWISVQKEDTDTEAINPAPSPAPSLILESSPSVGSATKSSSLVVTDAVLGFGSHGTVVYRGSLQGRAVAVKRLLQDFVTLASHEVNILQESDDHPNVIRYYYQEAHANFLYIALELCPASLADIVEYQGKEELRDIVIAFNAKRALKEITSGLRHLHALKLVHRDIKPQNILVSSMRASGGRNGGYRMLISDFGLCKKLDLDQTSFLPTAYGANAAGTVGWRAPEILRGEVKLDVIGDDQSISSSRGSSSTINGASTATQPKLTKSVDIFALGCLFYYTLTNGIHPYGDRFEREVNILKNEKNLEGLGSLGEEGSEAVDLIEQMLDPEAYARPDTTACLLHPFFWDPGRRLNFLQEASDRFEIMCRDPKDGHLIALEENASAIVGNDWQTRVDKIFLENLGKFRKYDGRSVQDLLRALRNKKHHYQDLPDNVKRHLGSMPEGYLAYFTKRYPRLFLHVHSVVGNTSLRYESMFRSYYELSEG